MIKRIKVLHVIRSLHKAGAEKICIDICDSLNNRAEVDVLLVSLSEENSFKSKTEKLPFKIINSKVFPSITRKKIVDINEFEKIISEFKPDVIHSHLFWSELLVKEKTHQHIKYVTHCHDNIQEFKKFGFSTLLNKKSITKFYERLYIIRKLKKCDNHFIAISEDTKNYFNKVLPKSIRKVKLLHNAINTVDYKMKTSKKELEKLVLVNIGRFAKYKNQQFLVDVAFKLKERGYPIELHFLGEGPEFENVKYKTKTLKLQSEVFFHGNVDFVQKFLWDSFIYVHSAIYEPFGLVLLEAMSAGLPVISVNGKGNKDLIVNDNNGYLLEEDVELFSNKIIKLWENKKKYNAMSKYAINYADKFDIKNYTDNLVEFYFSLLK